MRIPAGCACDIIHGISTAVGSRDPNRVRLLRRSGSITIACCASAAFSLEALLTSNSGGTVELPNLEPKRPPVTAESESVSSLYPSSCRWDEEVRRGNGVEMRGHVVSKTTTKGEFLVESSRGVLTKTGAVVLLKGERGRLTCLRRF